MRCTQCERQRRRLHGQRAGIRRGDEDFAGSWHERPNSHQPMTQAAATAASPSARSDRARPRTPPGTSIASSTAPMSQPAPPRERPSSAGIASSRASSLSAPSRNAVPAMTAADSALSSALPKRCWRKEGMPGAPERPMAGATTRPARSRPAATAGSVAGVAVPAQDAAIASASASGGKARPPVRNTGNRMTPPTAPPTIAPTSSRHTSPAARMATGTPTRSNTTTSSATRVSAAAQNAEKRSAPDVAVMKSPGPETAEKTGETMPLPRALLLLASTIRKYRLLFAINRLRYRRSRRMMRPRNKRPARRRGTPGGGRFSDSRS